MKKKPSYLKDSSNITKSAGQKQTAKGSAGNTKRATKSYTENENAALEKRLNKRGF